MSRIENRVAAEIIGRSKLGKAKYGVTMDREDLSTLEWLQHAKEEAMDLAVYLEKLIQEYNYMPPCSAHDKQMQEDEMAEYMYDGEECDGELGSHPLCCTDYCPCKEAEIEGSIAADLADIEREKFKARYTESEVSERRMRHIGQNGNDGLHYMDDERESKLNMTRDYDEATYLLNKTNWADKNAIQKKQQLSDYPESNGIKYVSNSTQ